MSLKGEINASWDYLTVAASVRLARPLKPIEGPFTCSHELKDEADGVNLCDYLKLTLVVGMDHPNPSALDGALLSILFVAYTLIGSILAPPHVLALLARLHAESLEQERNQAENFAKVLKPGGKWDASADA
jgi:hypothetical protein